MPTLAVTLLMLALGTPDAVAQESIQAPEQSDQAASPQEPRENYYRAEFVILERLVDPDEIQEQMASRTDEALEDRRDEGPTGDPDTREREEQLWVVDKQGGASTTLELVPEDELHLQTAAERLERSGRFRILLAAGWYQAFPPDFEGEPLQVAIGDWLEEAGLREVEGQITIDRQRYLHVEVHLDHWQSAPTGAETPAPSLYTEENPITGEASIPRIMSTADDILPSDTGTAPVQAEAGAELLTWIRETRRMRSEEVHYLDSPTIGVLIFFKRIEE